jgi:hypothetical protein
MLGIQCKMLRNSAALGAGYATPTFNDVESVMDVDYSLTQEEFETTTRAEKGIKVYETTLTNLEINFMLRVPELAAAAGNPDFDDFLAFETAHQLNNPLDIMVLSAGATTNGARGFRGFFKVHEFSESQKNGESLFRKVILKPCAVDPTTKATTSTAEAFRWARVAAGAVTYASLGSNTYA